MYNCILIVFDINGHAYRSGTGAPTYSTEKVWKFCKKKKKWNQIIEWRKNVFAFKFLWEQEAREKEDEMVRTAAEAAHVER